MFEQSANVKWCGSKEEKRRKKEYCVSMWKNVWKTEQPLSFILFFWRNKKKPRQQKMCTTQVILVCEYNDKISENAYRFTWFWFFDIAKEYLKRKKKYIQIMLSIKKNIESEHYKKNFFDWPKVYVTHTFLLYSIMYVVWNSECSKSNVEEDYWGQKKKNVQWRFGFFLSSSSYYL